jgi:hypothetical protein
MLRGISHFHKVMNKVVIALGGKTGIPWDVRGFE